MFAGRTYHEPPKDEYYTTPEVAEALLKYARPFHERRVACPFNSKNHDEIPKHLRAAGFDTVVTSGDYRQHIAEHVQRREMVVDNPPFSIICDIVAAYLKAGVDFILLAPLCFMGYKISLDSRLKFRKVARRGSVAFTHAGELRRIPCIIVTNMDLPFFADYYVLNEDSLEPVIAVDGTLIFNKNPLSRPQTVKTLPPKFGAPITARLYHTPKGYKVTGIIRPVVNGKCLYVRVVYEKVS